MTSPQTTPDTPQTVAEATSESCSAHAATGEHGYTKNKDAHVKRLRRIEGQIRGLQRMVDEDVYCIDILTQVSASTKALQSFALQLLEEHLRPSTPACCSPSYWTAAGSPAWPPSSPRRSATARWSTARSAS